MFCIRYMYWYLYLNKMIFFEKDGENWHLITGNPSQVFFEDRGQKRVFTLESSPAYMGCVRKRKQDQSLFLIDFVDFQLNL